MRIHVPILPTRHKLNTAFKQLTITHCKDTGLSGALVHCQWDGNTRLENLNLLGVGLGEV